MRLGLALTLVPLGMLIIAAGHGLLDPKLYRFAFVLFWASLLACHVGNRDDLLPIVGLMLALAVYLRWREWTKPMREWQKSRTNMKPPAKQSSPPEEDLWDRDLDAR